MPPERVSETGSVASQARSGSSTPFSVPADRIDRDHLPHRRSSIMCLGVRLSIYVRAQYIQFLILDDASNER